MNARAMFPNLRGYRLTRRPSDSILPSKPRPMRRDCHGRLLRALCDLAGEHSDIQNSIVTAWASATFIGARHKVIVELRSTDAAARGERLAATLPETEFTLPGHIVADLVICDFQVDHQPGETRAILTLSILTIESW